VSLCLAGTAVAISLTVPGFTLAWTHSVEKIEWREQWRVAGTTLVLESSSVQGSGAGMEPADDATLVDGAWMAPGHLAPQAVLRLAVSGATGRGWQFCAPQADCRDLERWLSQDGHPTSAIEIRAGQPCQPLGSVGGDSQGPVRPARR
jgi:hypothetical protein